MQAHDQLAKEGAACTTSSPLRPRTLSESLAHALCPSRSCTTRRCTTSCRPIDPSRAPEPPLEPLLVLARQHPPAPAQLAVHCRAVGPPELAQADEVGLGRDAGGKERRREVLEGGVEAQEEGGEVGEERRGRRMRRRGTRARDERRTSRGPMWRRALDGGGRRLRGDVGGRRGRSVGEGRRRGGTSRRRERARRARRARRAGGRQRRP